MTIRSAIRCRTRSSTWRASSTGHSGRTMTNSSPPVAARDIGRAQGVSEDLREGPQSAIAGGVSEDVVQLLEVVEVAVGHGIRHARVVELPDRCLQTPPGHEPREGVTVCLSLGDLEGAQHGQALTCPSCDHLDVPLYRVVGWRTVVSGHMEDPHGVAADAHRNAQCGATPASEVGTGIERRAGGEHHGPCPRGGGAIVGGHDPTTGIVFLSATDEHLSEVGCAGIGKEQLGPHARSSLAESLCHQIEDGRLRLGHLQCGLQNRLELDPVGEVGLNGLTSGLLTLHPQRVSGDDRRHDDREGPPDGKGPQKVDPGTVRCRSCLVGRRIQTAVDGRLQGGEGRIEARFG